MEGRQKVHSRIGKMIFIYCYCLISHSVLASDAFIPTTVRFLTNKSSKIFPYAVALHPRDHIPNGNYEIIANIQLTPSSNSIPIPKFEEKLKWTEPADIVSLGWKKQKDVYLNVNAFTPQHPAISFKLSPMTQEFQDNEQFNIKYYDELWFDYEEIDQDACLSLVKIDVVNQKPPFFKPPTKKLVGVSEALFMQSIVHVDSANWLPRNFKYLIKRILQRAGDENLYYKETNHYTMIERLFHKKLNQIEVIELVFLPKTQLNGVHLRIKKEHEFLTSEIINIAQIPHSTINLPNEMRVQLYIGELPQLKKINSQHSNQKIILTELGVSIQGNQEQVAVARPLKKVVFLQNKQNDTITEHSNKIALHQSKMSFPNNRKRIMIDLHKLHDLDFYFIGGSIALRSNNKMCAFKPLSFKLVKINEIAEPEVIAAYALLDQERGGPFLNTKADEIEWIKNDSFISFNDLFLNNLTDRFEWLKKAGVDFGTEILTLPQNLSSVELIELASTSELQTIKSFNQPEYIIFQDKLWYFNQPMNKLQLVSENNAKISEIKNILKNNHHKRVTLKPNEIKSISMLVSDGISFEGHNKQDLTWSWSHPMHIKDNTYLAVSISEGIQYIQSFWAEMEFKSGEKKTIPIIPNHSTLLEKAKDSSDILEKIIFHITVDNPSFLIKLKEMTIFHPVLIKKNNLMKHTRPSREWSSLDLEQVIESGNTLTSLKHTKIYGISTNNHTSHLSWITPINQPAHTLELLRFSHHFNDKIKNACWLNIVVHGEHHVSDSFTFCPKEISGQLTEPFYAIIKGFEPDEKILYIQWMAEFSPLYLNSLAFNFKIRLLSNNAPPLKKLFERAFFKNRYFKYTPLQLNNKKMNALADGDEIWLSYGKHYLSQESFINKQPSHPFFKINQLILMSEAPKQYYWEKFLEKKKRSDLK